MPSIMESRTKRGSRSLPVPLIFKSTLDRTERDDFLQTPPATGSKSARKMQALHSALPMHLLPAMPYTPISPQPSVILPPAAGDLHASELLDDPVIPKRTGKRNRTDVEEEEDFIPTPRLAKQRRVAARLIPHPYATLESQNVPPPYFAAKVAEVARHYYDTIEGATCLITCVPQTRPGRLRVKVVPDLLPQAPFYMHFNTTTPCSDDQTDAQASPRETQTKGRAIPLHIEVALLRAPILARLLLSGHVFLGDTLEMELPHPEVFEDVMTCLYTGQVRRSNRDKIEQCLQVMQGPSTEEVSSVDDDI